MTLTNEQINELSEWLDEAIDRMDALRDNLRVHEDFDGGTLWAYAGASANCLREMRNCIVKHKRHESRQNKED